MKALIFLSLWLAGWSAEAQLRVRTQKVNIQPTTVVVSVTFASAPTAYTALMADLKYNKQAVFNFESDDNALNFRYPVAMLMGGKAPDSTTYPRLTFTDGCGNAVGFRAALAVNARGGYNNNEISYFGNFMNNVTYGELSMLVKNDWAIENHSYYHDPTTRYSYKYDAGRNVRELHSLMSSKLASYGTPYVIRTLVAPTAWPNFERVADSLGYLCASSQGQRDFYPLYPASGQTYFDIQSLPPGFVSFGRAFDDAWSTANIANWKSTIDGLISGSSATKHLMWRLGTHGPQNAANFLNFMQYVQTSTGDKLWVTTMHELMEYLELKRLAIVSKRLSGNVLTLTINLSKLPAQNRFRDMSWLITGAGTSVSGVSVVGADSYSVNTSTGLINLFKKKTSGF